MYLENKKLFFESDSPKFHFSPHNWAPTDGEMDYETFFTTELPPLFLLLWKNLWFELLHKPVL